MLKIRGPPAKAKMLQVFLANCLLYGQMLNFHPIIVTVLEGPYLASHIYRSIYRDLLATKASATMPDFSQLSGTGNLMQGLEAKKREV